MIAQISGISFGFAVKFAVRFVLLEIETEGIILGGGFIRIASVSGELLVASGDSVFLAVERKVSIGENLLGDAIDPPIHEIKVMRAFVHEQ